MKFSVILNIKTVSEANSSEHWTKSSKRHKQQQFFVRQALRGQTIGLPAVITLCRISPRLLDSEENLPMAFKWIKDEIGACIFPEKVVVYRSKSGKIQQNKGHADSNPLLTWKYSQEKGKIQAVRIEIEKVKNDD